jgi:hypothetical protein
MWPAKVNVSCASSMLAGAPASLLDTYEAERLEHRSLARCVNRKDSAVVPLPDVSFRQTEYSGPMDWPCTRSDRGTFSCLVDAAAFHYLRAGTATNQHFLQKRRRPQSSLRTLISFVIRT